MKKILLFAIVACMFSCSEKELDKPKEQLVKSSKLAPPVWIQGEWVFKQDITPYKLGYKFSKDNFCFIVDSKTICFKEVIGDGSYGFAFEQKSSSTVYEIALKTSMVSYYYKFKKLSDREIEWTNASKHPKGYRSIFVKK